MCICITYTIRPNTAAIFSSNVDFAGYSIPHPSVNKLNMRIQTTGKAPLPLHPIYITLVSKLVAGQPAVEALDKSLRDLKELNEHVLATFKLQCDEHRARGGKQLDKSV